jgi:hypothetical protein
VKVTIKHPARNLTAEFNTCRDAAVWVGLWKGKKLPLEDLVIDSPYPLAYFAPHIPVWAQDLMVDLTDRYGKVVPDVHWINKHVAVYYSGGRTWYAKGDSHKVTHITISAGSNIASAKEVLLHEWAHAVCGHGAAHGRAFYRALFPMFAAYLTRGSLAFDNACEREFEYKRTSRYWYAELYQIKKILEEYHGVGYDRDIIDEMFGGMKA